MRLSVTHNFPAVQRKLEQLRKDIASKALVSTLNKVGDQAKTLASKEVREEFNLKAAVVREQLRVTRAYANGRVNIKVELVARGRGKGRSLGVVEFAAREVAKGVQIKIRKKGARTLIRNAFIATMPSGHRGVFVRRGKARLKIDEVYTIDLPQMFNSRRINKKVLDFMVRKFPEVFEREAAFYLRRFNGSR